MKKILTFAMFLMVALGVAAQDCYWVFLADKRGSTFDPYTYFDAKAIERYRQVNADLYDISNYPLVEGYVAGVNAIATENVGNSRWMNAMGVIATTDQIAQIERLPYVVRVQRISADMRLASRNVEVDADQAVEPQLADQLLRMQGELFREKGLDGKGIRIAVLDGGFPKVDVHNAFEHLRNDHRILKTWNFAKDKENVYMMSNHGTMTLSCIAGRFHGLDLGLATGSEFLLAVTEVEAEPFKEEIWWMEGMEWADRNGANIISSSLGYGKDRYYTKDMDGQSYVAKAGNMAARKGMLVFCSAGNEGTDKRWVTIVTPSDADSVMCVGGTTRSLTEYEHMDFASYGPTADGRQKPNVSAFANALAASPSGDDSYEYVDGTSFSCPLVAGFAACAWQASPGKSNMEMFKEIERSADLYPYCDYALGYGVPQADHFTGHAKAVEPTLAVERISSYEVSFKMLKGTKDATVFYKDVDNDGRIIYFGSKTFQETDTGYRLHFDGGHHVYVSYLGYMADHKFDEPTSLTEYQYRDWCTPKAKDMLVSAASYGHHVKADGAKETHWEWDELYFLFGLPASIDEGDLHSIVWSPATHIGVRVQYHFSKAYGIGLGLSYGSTRYNFGNLRTNALEQALGVDPAATYDDIDRRYATLRELDLELFQRVRLLPGGMLFHKGLHWDLGAYVGMAYGDYTLKGSVEGDQLASSYETEYNRVQPFKAYRLHCGLVTRLTNDVWGVYVRYRLLTLADKPANAVTLPALEFGIQLQL